MEEYNSGRKNKLLQHAVVIFLCLMIVYGSVLGYMVYAFLHVDWIFGYAIIFVMLHLQVLIFHLKTKFIYETSITYFYYVFIFTYLFPAVLGLYQISVYSILLFYILLPLVIMIRFYASKYMILAIVYSVLYILAIIITSTHVQILQIDVSQNQHTIVELNLFIIVAACSFIVVFLYFQHRILMQANDKTDVPVVEEEQKMSAENNLQMEELYNDIIDFFEKNHPYLQQNYRITTLATDLNTNVKYLSDAINMNFHGTFDGILNKYRLQYAKNMLDKGLAQKYTMEYIYTMSGYSNRSTFYENFRKTFNMTPTEYQILENTNKSPSPDVKISEIST